MSRDEHPEHPVDRALGALPARRPDAVGAERIRLRARMELAGAARATPWGRGWYAVEPYATGAVVIAFLGWTAFKLALLLG